MDSDDLHFRAYRTVLQRSVPSLNGGAPITRAFYDERMSGKQNRAIMAELAPTLSPPDRNAIWEEKEREYFAYVDAGIHPICGLEALLDRLEAADVRTAVVTNAPRRMAAHTLAALRLDTRFAERVIIGEECASPKPAPDPYIAGLELVGAHRTATVAFEDSPSGIASARAAGLYTVGVMSSRTEDDLKRAGANLCISDYEDPALWAALCERLNIEN